MGAYSILDAAPEGCFGARRAVRAAKAERPVSASKAVLCRQLGAARLVELFAHVLVIGEFVTETGVLTPPACRPCAARRNRWLRGGPGPSAPW